MPRWLVEQSRSSPERQHLEHETPGTYTITANGHAARIRQYQDPDSGMLELVAYRTDDKQDWVRVKGSRSTLAVVTGELAESHDLIVQQNGRARSRTVAIPKGSPAPSAGDLDTATAVFVHTNLGTVLDRLSGVNAADGMPLITREMWNAILQAEGDSKQPVLAVKDIRDAAGHDVCR